jgi:hypothetical protein
MGIKIEVGQVPMASATVYADRSPIEEEAIKIARELRDAKASIEDYRHIVENRNKVEKKLRERVIDLENRLASKTRYADALIKVIQERDISINNLADEADKQDKRLANLIYLRKCDKATIDKADDRVTELQKKLSQANKPAEYFRWVAQKVYEVAEANAMCQPSDPRFSLGVVFSYDEVQRLLRQMSYSPK